MTTPMKEKAKELYEKFMKLHEKDLAHTGEEYAIESLVEAIAYGRSSALAEVEKELPEEKGEWYWRGEGAEAYGFANGYNEYKAEVKPLISSKRGEEGK